MKHPLMGAGLIDVGVIPQLPRTGVDKSLVADLNEVYTIVRQHLRMRLHPRCPFVLRVRGHPIRFGDKHKVKGHLLGAGLKGQAGRVASGVVIAVGGGVGGGVVGALTIALLLLLLVVARGPRSFSG